MSDKEQEKMIINIPKSKDNEYQVRFWCDKETYIKFQDKCRNNGLDVKFVFDYLMKKFLRSKLELR